MLPGQFPFTAGEHGFEFVLFQHFGAHCRAAKGNCVIVIHLRGVKITGCDQCRINARSPCTFQYCLSHGLGIARCAPIYNCCFTHTIKSFLSASHNQLLQ